MSKLLHCVLVALGLALVTATPSLAQPVRVRAPTAPSIVTSAGECSAHVGVPHVRNACYACVNRGGRFHLGSNTCHGVAAPPPPPPASVSVARSIHECNTIDFGPKRNRCVSCVSGNGTYFVHSNGGFGHCNQAAPPPPPPPHHGDRTVQRTVGECYSEIGEPDKRLRCRTCVQNGGSYFKHAGNGFGQCTTATPVAEQSVLRTVSDCTAYTHGGHRVRCVNCIQAGGTFFRHAAGGMGQCSMPAPPPPPPSPVMLRTVGECSSYVPAHHQRRACLRCVASGSTYRTDTGGCFGAPPPPPPGLIYNVGDCFSRISHPGMRHQCRQCIHRGGRWDLSGACRH